MLQQHEDFASEGLPAIPQHLPQSATDKQRKVRRVVISEECAAVSLPNLPWDDLEE